MIDLESKDYDLKRAVSAFCDLAEDAKTFSDWDQVDLYFGLVLDLAQGILQMSYEGVGK